MCASELMQLIDLMILARLQFVLQFQNILQFHRTAINLQLTSLTEVHFIGLLTANKLWLWLRFGLNFFDIAKYYYFFVSSVIYCFMVRL